ncbi:Protein C25D7.15 a [Aphelenchoides avenae]|nr:Protein C25D7.15 a [Aphelenchus avenae]
MTTRFLLLTCAPVLLHYVTVGTEALDCYGSSANVSRPEQLTSCGVYAKECYKYACNSPQSNYVLKGCLEPDNTLVTCGSMQAQCQGKRGTGACYTCTEDQCNNALRPLGYNTVAVCFVTSIIIFLI